MARVERKRSGTFQTPTVTGLQGSDQPVVPRGARWDRRPHDRTRDEQRTRLWDLMGAV
jgi:hypothetical protein